MISFVLTLVGECVNVYQDKLLAIFSFFRFVDLRCAFFSLALSLGIFSLCSVNVGTGTILPLFFFAFDTRCMR